MKKIGEYVVFGLVALGFIVIYAALHATNFNIYIFLVGVMLVVIPAAIFATVAWISHRNAPPVKRPEDLIFTGVKIPVNLSECQVRSNNWTSEVERYDSPRVALLNEIGGDSDKNVERVVSNISRVEYTCEFNGRTKTFVSAAIAKDQVTTMLLLEMQRETAIYVNRDDDTDYYFDIAFLCS